MNPPPAGDEGRPAQESTDRQASAVLAAAELRAELEVDSLISARLPLKEAVGFQCRDTTMNVLHCSNLCHLKCLTEGAFQYLLAGARANVGVKSGRYLFEVKVIECGSLLRDAGLQPRSLLRVGLSTSKSVILEAADDGVIYFDLEGGFTQNRQRTTIISQPIERGDVLGVLINLDMMSPNRNTISLFRDGVRVCEPQPVPESLHGKALYPAVTFLNMTVHYNFGPEPYSHLPFRCRMLSTADDADCEVAISKAAREDDRCDALFPVSLPGEGGFDWLDMFLKTNQNYTELSERAVVAWAARSGLPREKVEICWDNKGFGIPYSDALKSLMQAVVCLQRRDLVVMEPINNLLKDKRQIALARFPSRDFRRIAHVLLGEPPADFWNYTQMLLLSEKQAKSDRAFHARKADELRAKQQARKHKELQGEKRVVKQKLEAGQLRKLAEKNAKEASSARCEVAKGENMEGEMKPGDSESLPTLDAEVEAVQDDDNDDIMKDNSKPPKVYLDDAERQVKFRKTAVPDVEASNLSTLLCEFTLPKIEEGFDEIVYSWSPAPQAEEYLKSWIQRLKLNTRVEVTPSVWFHRQYVRWQNEFQVWTSKQTSFEELSTKREVAHVEEKPPDATDLAPIVVGEPACVNFDDLDVFGVFNICDVGGGVPLFKEFTQDDWIMCGLRFELSLLLHAFHRDVEDPEQRAMHLDNVAFYYQKYYGRELLPSDFSLNTLDELVNLITDCVYLNRDKVLGTALPEDPESFDIVVKLTEEARRQRHLLLDMGEESARLRINHGDDDIQSQGGKSRGKAPCGKGAWRQKGRGRPVQRVQAPRVGGSCGPIPACKGGPPGYGGKGFTGQARGIDAAYSAGRCFSAGRKGSDGFGAYGKGVVGGKRSSPYAQHR